MPPQFAVRSSRRTSGNTHRQTWLTLLRRRHTTYDMGIAADRVIEAFTGATEENQVDPRRHNQVTVLGSDGELWITGDIHDHQRNFDKILKQADLARNPQRHLILHELIHGDRFDVNGADGSWEMLYRAAELKCDYPAQVHFLLANHDLAQIYGEGIMKAGTSVCEAFNAGVRRDFAGREGSVTAAITDFLLSLPLALRATNGLFVCHSLPTDAQMEQFDFSIFDRPLVGADYRRRVGSVYQLIWGRNTSPAAVEKFAQHVNAKLIITGHQPQESGYLVNGSQHLIIATDHNRGVVVQADLAVDYDMPRLVECVKPVMTLGISPDEFE